MNVTRRGFVMGIGMATLALAGCKNDQEKNSVLKETDPPEQTNVEKQTPTPEQLRVTDSCFSHYAAIGGTYCTVIVENPNTKYASAYPKTKITVFDESGNVIGTTSETSEIVFPTKRVAYCVRFSTGDAVPASVEASVVEQDPDEFAEWDMEEDGDPDLTVSGLNETDRQIGGMVHNPYAKTTDIAVVIAMRDESGNLVDGALGLAEDVPAESDGPFVAYTWHDAEPHATIEGYADARIPS